MLVSVITICYNSEAVIRKTIESVLAQTWPEIEYLIIDGASKDNTVAVAREYEERFAARGISYQIFRRKSHKSPTRTLRKSFSAERRTPMKSPTKSYT